MTHRPRAPALLAMASLALGGLAAGLAACSKRSSSMSILSTTPPAGGQEVPADAVVRVVFSASVNEETLTAESFRVRGSESGTPAGRITYDDPSRSAAFDPTADFKDGEEVTVELRGSIRGKSGAGLRGHTFSFRIRPAAPPPPPPPPPTEGRVVGRNPAPYSVAEDDATVYVEFSERMDPLTFSAHTVGLEGSLGGRIAVQIADIAVVGTRVAILPRRRFLPGEWITVRLGRALRTTAGGGFPGEAFGFRARAFAPAEPRLPGPTT
ncbi:MAG: Ig-like domain-containing protein, partial [Candidatus Methylomirabilales bacterium]